MSTLEVITLPSGAVSTLCTSAIACTFLLKDARLLICDCWGFATNQAAAPSRSRWNIQLFKERKGKPGGFASLILWMGSQDCTSDVAESILLRDKCDQGESVAVKQNSDYSVFISRKYKHGKTDGIVAKSFRFMIHLFSGQHKVFREGSKDSQPGLGLVRGTSSGCFALWRSAKLAHQSQLAAPGRKHKSGKESVDSVL